MAGIIVLTAWPIRGDCVPQETGGNLSLTALFAPKTRQFLPTFHISLKISWEPDSPGISYPPGHPADYPDHAGNYSDHPGYYSDPYSDYPDYPDHPGDYADYSCDYPYHPGEYLG